MNDRNKNIRFLLGVAKNVQEYESSFAIAYPDNDNVIKYVNEYGEPQLKVPDGITIIKARDKEQKDLWVHLYECAGDSFIVGNRVGSSRLPTRPAIKLADNFCIAI